MHCKYLPHRLGAHQGRINVAESKKCFKSICLENVCIFSLRVWLYTIWRQVAIESQSCLTNKYM